MKDFRDKGRKPRFNREGPKPRRFDKSAPNQSLSKPRPKPTATTKPARVSPPPSSSAPMRDDRRPIREDRPSRQNQNHDERRTFDRGGERDRGGDRSSAGNEREIVYGVEPIRELVAAAPKTIRVLYVKSGDERRFSPEINEVRTAGGRVEFVDETGLERVAGAAARHQGIAALMHEYEYANLDDILEQKPDPVLLVDGVTDPRNLGALMRSAEGAGVGALVLAKDRTVGITPAVVKSSSGAWIHLRIARCGNVARTLEQLKEAGYWIAALAAGGDTSIYKLDTTRKLVLVVGSEGRGVRDIVRKGSDFVVDIPMRGQVGSLNVSVAGAVALYEIARRRSESAVAGD